jgi:DnaA family protein
MTPQLPLELRWPARQRFETFVVGANAAVLAGARRMAIEAAAEWAFLAGPAGSGKTHLLMATCAAASLAGRSAQYIALATVPEPRAAAIRGLGGSDLLALDDLDAMAGDALAEHALFDLYNRSRAERGTLLFAARHAPAALGIRLPDLASRLASSAQWTLRALDEASRRAALRERGAARGIELDDAVLDWLFTRQARDLGSLTALLDRIDSAALAAQRRVTVPFLRDLLS